LGIVLLFGRRPADIIAPLVDTTARKWNLRAAIISIGVVACLCFSIGEGLRLTPFPVSVVSEAEGFKDANNSLRRYGPLDVPARAQSRNKRQVVDYAFSAPERALELPRAVSPVSHESLELHQIYTGSPPIGRAPPAC
jgi:hypothetical protein